MARLRICGQELRDLPSRKQVRVGVLQPRNMFGLDLEALLDGEFGQAFQEGREVTILGKPGVDGSQELTEATVAMLSLRKRTHFLDQRCPHK